MDARATTWRRRALAAAIATALGTGLAVPATGVGGVPAIQDDVLATASLDEIPDRIKLIRSTRAKVARLDVFWSDVSPTKPRRIGNPADPAYDWSRIDDIVKRLAAAKITPIISAYSTPAWAVAGRHTPFQSHYNPNAPRPAQFAAFMRAMATRYSGRFRNPGPGPRFLPRVRHYEIWNEPNLRNFFRFNGRSSLPRYIALVRAAYPQIKRANRRSIVIAGVGGPRSSQGGGNIGARRWLRGIVAAPRLRFDAYSQHIYPAAGPRARTRAFPAWNSIPEILRTLDRKRRGMKLYITEAGYTTAATPFRNVRVTPRVQNRYLNQIFTLPTVRSSRVAAVVWFNLQDNVNWPAGLYRANGTRKPSYRSFVKFARRPIQPALRKELAR